MTHGDEKLRALEQLREELILGGRNEELAALDLVLAQARSGDAGSTTTPGGMTSTTSGAQSGSLTETGTGTTGLGTGTSAGGGGSGAPAQIVVGRIGGTKTFSYSASSTLSSSMASAHTERHTDAFDKATAGL